MFVGPRSMNAAVPEIKEWVGDRPLNGETVRTITAGVVNVDSATRWFGGLTPVEGRVNLLASSPADDSLTWLDLRDGEDGWWANTTPLCAIAIQSA